MLRSNGIRWGTVFVTVLLSPLLLAQTADQHDAAVLQIQLDRPIAKVSPTLYGLMTEEINHSYDGGIYAEMVRNRSFQDSRSVLRMGVHHPTDLREGPIQHQVRRQIGRWLQSAVYNLPVHIRDHHVLWCQCLIIDATRLDYH